MYSKYFIQNSLQSISSSNIHSKHFCTVNILINLQWIFCKVNILFNSQWIYYFIKSLVYSPHDPGDGVLSQPLPHDGDGVVEDGEWQGDVVLHIVQYYHWQWLYTMLVSPCSSTRPSAAPLLSAPWAARSPPACWAQWPPCRPPHTRQPSCSPGTGSAWPRLDNNRQIFRVDKLLLSPCSALLPLVSMSM